MICGFQGRVERQAKKEESPHIRWWEVQVLFSSNTSVLVQEHDQVHCTHFTDLYRGLCTWVVRITSCFIIGENLICQTAELKSSPNFPLYGI